MCFSHPETDRQNEGVPNRLSSLKLSPFIWTGESSYATPFLTCGKQKEEVQCEQGHTAVEEQTTERRASPPLALASLPSCTSPLGPESHPNLIRSQAGAGQLAQLSHIFNRFHQA